MTIYMHMYFEPYTLPTTAFGPTPYRLLVVDGHASHVGWRVVEYALDYCIIMYCLLCNPPTVCSLSIAVDEYMKKSLCSIAQLTLPLIPQSAT